MRFFPVKVTGHLKKKNHFADWCPCKCWMPPNGEQFRYSYVWFSIQPEHGFHQGFHHSAARLCSPKCFITSLAPLPTGMQCERAEAAGPAGSGTRCPLQPATKHRLRGTAWGGTWATLQWKKCPQESCGVLQAVAVLEDTARGQSACLESASSCYIPTKVPEQHFSCSSLFLFLCAFPQKVCYAHRQPRASEQVGWCWTRGLKVERTLLKEKGEVAELRYKQEKEAWDKHFLLYCIKRCFCMESPLYSQQHFPPCPPWPLPQQRHPTFPWQWHAGADALALVLSWRAAYPPTLCPEEPGLHSCGWHLLQHRTVASSSGKHVFIASPTAEHFGHEKYINVTTTFITIFIPHLMLALCDLHTKYIFKGKHIHFYLERKEDSK